MKTLVTAVFEIDWENKYDAHGTPDMEAAVREYFNETTNELFGHEWDMEDDVAYVEGPVKMLDLKIVNIDLPTIKPLPFCEHCGEGHEEFGCEFDVDGVSWCLNCYLSDKPGGSHLYNYYNEMVKKAEIKYLKNRLKKLENDG